MWSVGCILGEMAGSLVDVAWLLGPESLIEVAGKPILRGRPRHCEDLLGPHNF